MNQGREKENAGAGWGQLRGYSFNTLVREGLTEKERQRQSDEREECYGERH